MASLPPAERRSGAALTHPSRYDFLALACGLRRRARVHRRRVRFKSSVGLGFPPGAVRSCIAPTATRDGALEVQFFGLGGVSGPLPAVDTERALAPRGAGPVMRDLLDIVNDATLRLLLDALGHRLAGLDPRETDVHRTLLLAVAGLRRGMPVGPGPVSVGAFVTHGMSLGGTRRSFGGLEHVLRTRLGVPVRCDTLIGDWMPAPRPAVLGACGFDATLGTRIWDPTARVEVGVDLRSGRFPRAADEARQITRFYLGLACRIAVKRTLHPTRARLGHTRLGHSGCLGARDAPVTHHCPTLATGALR